MVQKNTGLSKNGHVKLIHFHIHTYLPGFSTPSYVLCIVVQPPSSLFCPRPPLCHPSNLPSVYPAPPSTYFCLQHPSCKKVSVKFLCITLYENLTFNDHVNKVRTKISKFGVMKSFSQLPAGIMLKFYYSLVFSHLTYALLAWGRSGHTNAAKIGCAHRRAFKLLPDYNHWILTFHLIYDYFDLLKAFNTNIVNFHQYFKDKLSSHQPSLMHKTGHRTNCNFNTQFFHY